jgi:hypothetical protein
MLCERILLIQNKYVPKVIVVRPTCIVAVTRVVHHYVQMPSIPLRQFDNTVALEVAQLCAYVDDQVLFQRLEATDPVGVFLFMPFCA